jgi:hypothetical protein
MGDCTTSPEPTGREACFGSGPSLLDCPGFVYGLCRVLLGFSVVSRELLFMLLLLFLIFTHMLLS